jgi:hypothetical protein
VLPKIGTFFGSYFIVLLLICCQYCWRPGIRRWKREEGSNCTEPFEGEERKEMEANEKRGGRGRGKMEANNPAGGGMDLLSLFLNAVLSG